MAYIPPHKRIFNRNPAPTPASSSVTSNLSPDSLNVTSQIPSPHKIPYSRPCFVNRWYATSTESLTVVPFDSEATEIDSKPLIVKVADEAGLVEEEEIGVLRGIVEKLARVLIKASQHAEEKEIESVDVKLLMTEKIEIANVQLLVMVGKVLFLGEPSACIDSIKKARASEGELNKEAKKTFYSRVSEDYIREVEQLLVEKCGFKFERAKERFHVKVRVRRQGNLVYSCKCKASDDSTLELYKVEQNPLKHMWTDVSCLSKNFDLRIMLNSKRAIKNLDADVADGIHRLISAAVIDPEAEGGLRWPNSGKESVVGVWHTKHTILSRDKIRVDLRTARRFDFTKSFGEDVNDVSFKLSDLSEILTGDHLCEGSIVDMIQEVIDLIWGNLLSLSYLFIVES